MILAVTKVGSVLGNLDVELSSIVPLALRADIGALIGVMVVLVFDG